MGVGPFPSFRPALAIPAWDRQAVAFARHFARALAADAQAEAMRRVLWLPVALGAGAGTYFVLPFEPGRMFVAALAVVAVLAAAAAAHSTGAARRFGLALLAAFAFGFAAAQLRTEMVRAPILSHRLGPVGIDGRVEQADAHGKGMRIVLGAVRFGRLAAADTPARVRISVRKGAEHLRPGQWVHLTAVLMPPPAPAEPGGYDFGRAAFFDRIGAVGYAYGAPRPAAASAEAGWRERMALAIADLRWRMTERIHAVLPGSTGGIASALITGDRAAISEGDEQALRDAGLAHVLAIAGLHMALVGLGLFWAVRAILAAIPALALRYPIKKWAALAALFAASFYLAISGAATPATRAFVMLAMMLTAILFDRPALTMRSVGFAAAIILFIEPEELIEPGFQMSFAAVVSLVAVAEWETARAARRRGEPGRFAGLRRYLHGIAVTSFVGSLATAPYAIFHFGRATHYAVLGNLLAMPVMGFVVMPMAALSVILMPFGLDAWPLHAMGWGIAAMLAMGRWVSGLPGAVSHVAAWPVAAMVLVSLGGLWVAIWKRHWRWLGLAPMALGLLVAATRAGPDLLVARDGMTAAVRGADGALWLMRAPKDSYAAGEWLEHDGDARTPKSAIASPRRNVRCDAYGCVAAAAGTLIAEDFDPHALAEDCATAEIVVSAIPLRGRCHGPALVIDKFDAMRAGGYAVWLGKSLRVETVAGARGQRPWSMAPAHRPRRAKFNTAL